MTEYGDMLAEWRKDARAFEARIAELERQLHDYQARVIPAETRVVALEAALLDIEKLSEKPIQTSDVDPPSRFRNYQGGY
jgi:chromosome segregation ATPase